ncbi:TraB/GumN family protein [Candidatus Woesearchaeota archaeon]|nr:TraB/GumN family protein [Candidatus Woesearchaeota archaeon]
MHYKNLTLIGTSHIAKESLKEVTAAIVKQQPDIIALELDKKRFYALTHEVKRRVRLRDIKKIGVKGFLFNLIGAWIEEKLGKLVGVKPGSEMLTAIHLAKEYKIKLALIDQDIELTLRRISAELTLKERLRFVIDILKGILFKKSEMKKLGIKKLDLTKVPPKTLIKKLIKIMKKRYPHLYRVLVEERNKVMAANLKNIMEHFPDKKIIAIIGAGHEQDILNLVKSPHKITYSYKIRNVYK